MTAICPKCHYQRQLSDSQVHEGICPRCGIAYAKYRAHNSTDEAANGTSAIHDNVEADQSNHRPVISRSRRLWDALTYVPDAVDKSLFWGRAVLLVAFTLWGGSFIIGGVDWEGIGSSFMHNINLPFHEFGHVLFGFMGRFMEILGGSLFQIIFPLIFVIVFIYQMRDNFSASICLWWCGQNFIDVSPYIADAKDRVIPLIRGLSEEHHDWGNLLTMTNSLDSSEFLANMSFAIGSIIIVLSLGWGGWLLWKQYHSLEVV